MAKRSESTLAVFIALARVSGLVKTLVLFAVLGTTTQLGNVYQSANAFPTIIFELAAAGSLGAALLPWFVPHQDRSTTEANQLAYRLLTRALMVVGALTALCVVGARPLATWLLSSGDGATDSDARDTLTVLVALCAPQLLAYVPNAIASSWLNANAKFGATSLCPLANNAVLLVTYGVFAWWRGSDVDQVAMSSAQLAWLGMGTTSGVFAMCAVVVVAARRNGFHPLSRRGNSDAPPRLPQGLIAAAIWTTLFAATTQILTLIAVLVGNGAAGNTLIWTVCWQVFLVPFAVLMVPAIATRFTDLVTSVVSSDHRARLEALGGGIQSVLFTGVLVAVAVFATSPAIATLVSRGHASGSVGAVSATLCAMVPGLIGFGGGQLLARDAIATGRPQLAAFVAIGLTAVGACAMWFGHGEFAPQQQPVWLAACSSAVFVVGALILTLLNPMARRAVRERSSLLARRAGFGAVACAGAWWIRTVLPARPSTPQSVIWLAVAAGAIACWFGVTDRIAGGPSWWTTVKSLGGEQ